MPGYVLSNGAYLNYTFDRTGLITIYSVVLREPAPTSISIPSQIDNMMVDVIADNCFRGSPLLKIELPDTVRHIGNCAFYNSSIQEIVLPKCLVSLDSFAFAYCNNLTDAIFRGGPKQISHGCFQKCLSLKNIHFSNDLEFIASAAFMGCSNLKHITFPKSVNTISNNAFSFCGLETISILGETVSVFGRTFHENPKFTVHCVKGSPMDRNFDSIFPCGSIKKCGFSDISCFLEDIADENKIKNKQI